jgi:Transglutaminase-like superfamily
MSGDAGVEQTINQMRSLVDEALRDPSINRLARDIVQSAPAFDDYAEAQALYNWVRQTIRFTKDPVNKETLYPPAELLKIRAGDCDDISMLMGTLLMSVGYPARLMTVAANGDEFSHVYAEGQINGQWIPMDPARSDSQFGVAPPAFTRARWWSLSDTSQGDLSASRLGNYPRFKSHVSGMGSYGRVRTMGALGDCAPGDVWTGSQCITPAPASGDSTSATIATIDQGAASLIRAASGQPASPFDFSAAGPWQSFQTQYSPYGVPAGYAPAVQPGVSVTGSSSWLIWGVLLVGAAMAFSGRRR